MNREEARNHLAEWLDEKMWRCFGTIDREAISIAVEALSEDKTERPKGKWIEEYNGNGWNDFWDYTCSNCGKKYKRADYLYHANYCPNCGAEMETENE